MPGCGDNEMRIATVEISEWSPSVSLVAWKDTKYAGGFRGLGRKIACQ